MDEVRSKLVAEIGCVHGGSLDRAIDLIRMAAECGADAVKSQKRNPYVSVPDHLKNLPHPNPSHSFGSSYLEHRLFLELSIESHMAMSNECHILGMEYGCSIWDLDSAIAMMDVDVDFIKIPSACCTDINLIEYCIKNYKKPLHISTGMTSQEQRNILYEHLKASKKDCVVYHTTSEYPCPFERLFLQEIVILKNMGFCVGFSNHGYGIAADVAALALGATWIERHFIDDRTYPHTDAAASLEPSGLKTLKRDLVNVSRALRPRPNSPTLEEIRQMEKLRP